MTTRRKIGSTERAEIFLRFDGRCHLCGEKIAAGEEWEADHVLELWEGGSDERGSDNIQPAHKRCHRQKTGRRTSERAKTKRLSKKHAGEAKASRHPMPFGRRSNLKKKLNGKVERR